VSSKVECKQNYAEMERLREIAMNLKNHWARPAALGVDIAGARKKRRIACRKIPTGSVLAPSTMSAGLSATRLRRRHDPGCDGQGRRSKATKIFIRIGASPTVADTEEDSMGWTYRPVYEGEQDDDFVRSR